MTVYEALVTAQSRYCGVALMCFDDMVHSSGANNWRIRDWQTAVDRAYLLGLAIDNLPADVANMEV